MEMTYMIWCGRYVWFYLYVRTFVGTLNAQIVALTHCCDPRLKLLVPNRNTALMLPASEDDYQVIC